MLYNPLKGLQYKGDRTSDFHTKNKMERPWDDHHGPFALKEQPEKSTKQ